MADPAAGTRIALTDETGSADFAVAGADAGSSSSSSSAAASSAASTSSSAPPAGPSSSTYTFERAEKDWGAFASSDLKESWSKWGLSALRSQACVRLTGRKFDPSEAPAFLSDLFSSPALREQLQHAGGAGVGAGAGLGDAGPVTRVRFTQLNTRVVSLSFFDRLCETGGGEAVLEGGYIRKRLDDEVDGVVVGDLLRQALLDPDGESPGYTGEHDFSGLYSPMERGELIYRVLKWIVTGGSVCQYEDNWQPYLDATKALYRDLVSVTKTGGADGTISVASYVYAVEGLEGPGGRSVPLHPKGKGDGSAVHSVCWVCVDPMRRTASVLHHTWVPFW